jgi:hypothetical protein
MGMVLECDSCHDDIKQKDVERALSCDCDICGPFTVCHECHVEIKRSKNMCSSGNTTTKE